MDMTVGGRRCLEILRPAFETGLRRMKERVGFKSSMWDWAQASQVGFVRSIPLLYDVMFVGPCYIEVDITGLECSTVWCRYNAVISFHKHSQKPPHNSPVREMYEMYFVDPVSDWYSASAPVIIYVISYNSGSRYNSTRLYNCRLIFFELVLLLEL